MKIRKFNEDKSEGLENVPTWLETLTNIFKDQRVRIVLGHPANGSYIEGIVTGFKAREGGFRGIPTEFLILLKDVTTNDKWTKDVVSEGKYDEHYIRPTDRIELVEEYHNLG